MKRIIQPEHDHWQKCFSLRLTAQFVFLRLWLHPYLVPFGAMRVTVNELQAAMNFKGEHLLTALSTLDETGLVQTDFANAPFLWLPDFVIDNVPHSSNHVKAWAKHLDGLPKCDGLTECLRHVGSVLEDIRPSFVDAFAEAFPFRYEVRNKI